MVKKHKNQAEAHGYQHYERSTMLEAVFSGRCEMVRRGPVGAIRGRQRPGTLLTAFLNNDRRALKRWCGEIKQGWLRSTSESLGQESYLSGLIQPREATTEHTRRRLLLLEKQALENDVRGWRPWINGREDKTDIYCRSRKGRPNKIKRPYGYLESALNETNYATVTELREKDDFVAALKYDELLPIVRLPRGLDRVAFVTTSQLLPPSLGRLVHSLQNCGSFSRTFAPLRATEWCVTDNWPFVIRWIKQVLLKSPMLIGSITGILNADCRETYEAAVRALMPNRKPSAFQLATWEEVLVLEVLCLIAWRLPLRRCLICRLFFVRTSTVQVRCHRHTR